MRPAVFKAIQNWPQRSRNLLSYAQKCMTREPVDGSRKISTLNKGEQSGTFSTINGVRLNYEVRGSGTHPIICIPGTLDTAKAYFGPQLYYFGREGSGFKIVSFDPQRYSASRPDERFDSNFFVADAKDASAIMQMLSLQKFSVLGWSGGGMAALHLAAMFPGNVKRLVIWSTSAYLSKEEIAGYEKVRDISNWSAKMRDPLLTIYGRSLRDLWSTSIDSATKLLINDISKGELSKVKCPTLIIHGTNDPVVPLFHAHYLHEHVTGSRLEVMEEAKPDHLRYSEEFNKMVVDFLKG